MKFAYKFSNLLGTVYQQGNVEFIKDGNTVISPVGNRVTLFDLKKNKSETLPVVTKFNISCLALAPDGFTLILVDQVGRAYLISLVSKAVLHHYNFKRPVTAIKFSPDGKKFAITKDDAVLIYYAPGKTKEINPFTLHRKYSGAYGKTRCIDWTSDSKAFAVGGDDMTVRVYAATKCDKLKIHQLGGHKNIIQGCFFAKDSLDIYTVGRSGILNIWNCDTELEDLHVIDDKKSGYSVDENEDVLTKPEASVLYSRAQKFSFGKDNEMAKVTACSFHKATNILVTGLSSGSFFIHELPDINLIHSLSISEYQISSIAINTTGEWLALASTGLGQLLVWDWQSESYVMKQQGHYSTMTCLDYSPDGRYLVTGGEDGKVKVWDTRSGFCFVTFTEHSAGITGVEFTSNGHVIVSSSLDGTVRAFDLHRYRNFRTFTSPRPSQFACIAADESGELIASGSDDSFEVFLWSLRTGRLLDVFAGHEAPVMSVAFSPVSSVLASGSWDHTVILWRIGEEKGAKEAFDVGHDVMAVAFRPDGKELAVSALNAEITFWDVQSTTQTGSIECRHDIGSGRGDTDSVSAKTKSYGKAFDSLCYTADGEAVIAAGQSKNVCVYHVKERLLIKKFQISKNRSFDGMEEFLSRRRMTEFGAKALFDMGGKDKHGDSIKLPGVRTGDLSLRSFKPEIRVSSVRFSPTGREWAAVSTEGLLIYSLDANMTFDPFELELDITPDNIRMEAKKKDYSKAIMMSLRLNEKDLITEVLEQVPISFIETICRTFPIVYVEKLLGFVADRLETSSHLHYYLLWCLSLLKSHGPTLKLNSSSVMSQMTHLQKAIGRKSEDIAKICDSNHYQISYILALSKRHRNKKIEIKENEDTMGESGDELSMLSLNDAMDF